MTQRRIAPLAVSAAALALGGCSVFRAGEPIPADAALNGDDGRLAAMVDSITPPVLADGAAMQPAAGRPVAMAAQGVHVVAPQVAPPISPAQPPASVIEARSVLFALHLASYRTEASAEAGWRIIEGEAPDTLEDLHPRIETVDLGPDRGVYLRLKAGPIDSRAEATARCAALVAEGHYCQTVDFEGREIPG